MLYAKVTGGYVEYSFVTKEATPFTKIQVQNELAGAEARLAEIPTTPTDEELLVWARENYFAVEMDYSVEVTKLNETITLCNARLAAVQVLENKI